MEQYHNVMEQYHNTVRVTKVWAVIWNVTVEMCVTHTFKNTVNAQRPRPLFVIDNRRQYHKFTPSYKWNLSYFSEWISVPCCCGETINTTTQSGRTCHSDAVSFSVIGWSVAVTWHGNVALLAQEYDRLVQSPHCVMWKWTLWYVIYFGTVQVQVIFLLPFPLPLSEHLPNVVCVLTQYTSESVSSWTVNDWCDSVE